VTFPLSALVKITLGFSRRNSFVMFAARISVINYCYNAILVNNNYFFKYIYLIISLNIYFSILNIFRFAL